MYNIKNDLAALNCLFQHGIINAKELHHMRNYLESIAYTHYRGFS